MIIEMLTATSSNKEQLEFENSMEESDDDDDDDEEFPPLPSDIDLPSYTNTPDPYDNRHHAMDFFYCISPPLPSPPTMTRIYANAHTFTSIRHHDSINQPIMTFATQQKKKARAPIASFLESVYVNIPISPPTPINISNEVTYATLMNTSSLVPPSYSDIPTNHVEYQQIEIPQHRIYENIKSRRPPPPPCDSPTNILQQSSSSEHIYINLNYHEDKPPTIPIRTCKPVAISIQASPPPPPIIPRRNEPKEDVLCSSTSVRNSPSEREHDGGDMNALETSSNASTVQTVKELEVNMAPSSGDKSDLYRTKMSVTIAENLPSMNNTRPKRTLHSIRRRRLRGSVALRGSTRGPIHNNTTNRLQNQRSNLNINVRHPMVTNDRWRRTLRKRRRQRVVQMKLDGNVLHQRTRSKRPTSDHTYNEIKQPILSNNLIHPNGHNGAAGGVLERAMQFNGALRDRVFTWYRGANHNDREQQTTQPQVLSTSENGESDQKDVTTNEDEGEGEEEFFTHDTFEDFLLRRRPKSSASTTASGTSTVVSHIESPFQRIPVPPSSNKKSRIPLPPVARPPPPPPPPLPLTPPPARRFPGIALGLDKTDVDFIHNMLQRTRGDHRVWNRITALKEAYIRATSKKHDLPKKPKPVQTQMDEKKKKKAPIMKHSLAATKIRAELEKYDELPVSSATVLDDDDYGVACSANDHLKRKYNPHYRSVPNLPSTPSTTHRFLSFVTSIKQRAQNNVQQLQKNLHDIRSRVHFESMTIPSNHIGVQRHVSTLSRQRQTFKDPSNTPRMPPIRSETLANRSSLVHRTNSHRSAISTEHSRAAAVVHRQQLNRTQSNVSQLPQQHRTHRLTSEKSAVTVDRSASLTTRPLPFERHSSHQTQNTITPRHSRAKKSS